MATENQQQTYQIGLGGGDETPNLEGMTRMAWEPPAYEFEEKTERWYLAGGVVAAVFISGAILFRNYLMAVTFFLLALVMYLYAERRPENIRVELKDFGLRIDDRFYPYRTIKRYWIVYRPGGTKTLNFEVDQVVNPVLTILIADQNPNDIRALLAQRVAEDVNQQESQLSQIARRFKI